MKKFFWSQYHHALIATGVILISFRAFAQDAGTSTLAGSGPIVTPEEATTLFSLLGDLASSIIAHGWLAAGAALVPLTLWVLNLKPLKYKLRSDGPIDWLRPTIMAVVTVAAVVMGALSEGISDLMTIIGSLGGAGVMGFVQKAIQEALD